MSAAAARLAIRRHETDMLLFMGLLILYARLERTGLMVLVWVAAFGSFMTSYARARAESLIPRCPVGLLERPERIVLIIAGALLNKMVAVLWIVAVLSNITAVQLSVSPSGNISAWTSASVVHPA